MDGLKPRTSTSLIIHVAVARTHRWHRSIGRAHSPWALKTCTRAPDHHDQRPDNNPCRSDRRLSKTTTAAGIRAHQRVVRKFIRGLAVNRAPSQF
jgi:hypothetical protein